MRPAMRPHDLAGRAPRIPGVRRHAKIPPKEGRVLPDSRPGCHGLALGAVRVRASLPRLLLRIWFPNVFGPVPAGLLQTPDGLVEVFAILRTPLPDAEPAQSEPDPSDGVGIARILRLLRGEFHQGAVGLGEVLLGEGVAVRHGAVSGRDSEGPRSGPADTRWSRGKCSSAPERPGPGPIHGPGRRTTRRRRRTGRARPAEHAGPVHPPEPGRSAFVRSIAISRPWPARARFGSRPRLR